MRIKLITTPNTIPVPFNYQEKLVGTLHKWIGENEIHDKISLYSYSWLQGGCLKNNALDFTHGSEMFISFHHEKWIKQIIRSILNSPEMFCGMCVTDIVLINSPDDLKNRELFFCASPILIKRKLANGSIRQYNFNDANAGELLKETLINKMRQAGLEDDETLDIQFDISYSKKKLKLVHYHNIGNKASLCPVRIKGKIETKLFAWNVGIGNSTGIGLGAIY